MFWVLLNVIPVIIGYFFKRLEKTVPEALNLISLDVMLAEFRGLWMHIKRINRFRSIIYCKKYRSRWQIPDNIMNIMQIT